MVLYCKKLTERERAVWDVKEFETLKNETRSPGERLGDLPLRGKIIIKNIQY